MSGSTSASYASRPKRRETNDATDSSSSPAAGGHVGLGREARLARGREQVAALERVEVRRDHPGQPLGKRMELVPAPDERAVVLGPAADQLVARGRAPRRDRRRAPCARGSCRRPPRSRTRRRARSGSSRRAMSSRSTRSPRHRERPTRAGVRPRAPRSRRRRRRPSRGPCAGDATAPRGPERARRAPR